MDPHKNSEELSEQALSSTEQCMNNFSDQKNARGVKRATSDADTVRKNKRRGRTLAASSQTCCWSDVVPSPFTPEPQSGTAKAYSRTALPVKLPRGAASRILPTVAIMSRHRRVRSLG